MDLNNDGNLDLITGMYGKNIHFFKGIGNNQLAAGELIKDSNGNTGLGINRFTGVAIVDYNNDELLDMVVACSGEGYVNGWDAPGPLKLYFNTGSKEQYKFEYQGVIKDKNGKEIRYVYHRVRFIDMNSDGLIDMVSSSTPDKNTTDGSEIYFHKNVGTVGNPVFDPAEILKHRDGSEIQSDYAIRLGASDFDNDGVGDVLINTSHHYPGKLGLLRGHIEGTSVHSTSTKIKSGIHFITHKDRIQISAQAPIKTVKIFSINGKLHYAQQNIDQNIFEVKRDFGNNFIILEVELFQNKIYLKKLMLPF